MRGTSSPLFSAHQPLLEGTQAGGSAQFLSSLKISWSPNDLNYCLSESVFACSHVFSRTQGLLSSSSQELSVQRWVSRGCGGDSRQSVTCVRKPFCELHIRGRRSLSWSACFYQPCSSCSHLLITLGWHRAPFSIPALDLLQAHSVSKCSLSPRGCQHLSGPLMVCIWFRKKRNKNPVTERVLDFIRDQVCYWRTLCCPVTSEDEQTRISF